MLAIESSRYTFLCVVIKSFGNHPPQVSLVVNVGDKVYLLFQFSHFALSVSLQLLHLNFVSHQMHLHLSCFGHLISTFYSLKLRRLESHCWTKEELMMWQVHVKSAMCQDQHAKYVPHCLRSPFENSQRHDHQFQQMKFQQQHHYEQSYHDVRQHLQKSKRKCKQTRAIKRENSQLPKS